MRLTVDPKHAQYPSVIHDVRQLESLVDHHLNERINKSKKDLLSFKYQFTIYAGWFTTIGLGWMYWNSMTTVFMIANNTFLFSRYLSWDVPILIVLFFGTVLTGKRTLKLLKQQSRVIHAIMVTFVTALLSLSTSMLMRHTLSIREVFETIGRGYFLMGMFALVGTFITAFIISIFGSRYVLLIISGTGIADIIGPLPSYTALTEDILNATMPSVNLWSYKRIEQVHESVRAAGSSLGTQSQIVAPVIGFFGLFGVVALIPSSRIIAISEMGFAILIGGCVITTIWGLFLVRGYRLLRVLDIADHLCIQYKATMKDEHLLQTLLSSNTNK